MNTLNRIIAGAYRGALEARKPAQENTGFKVIYGNIDDVVGMLVGPNAISGAFVLGETELPGPASNVQVVLKAFMDNFERPGSYPFFSSRLMLEAIVAPRGGRLYTVSDENLKAGLASLGINFGVSLIPLLGYSHRLEHPTLIEAANLRVPTHDDLRVLVMQEVKYRNIAGIEDYLRGRNATNLQGFARVVKGAVNAYYRAAGKPSPNVTLTLSAPARSSTAKITELRATGT